MRSIALVPAGGVSRRMGVNKLTLPLGGATVLHRTLQSLQRAAVDRVLVLLGPRSANVALPAGVEAVVLSDQTSDMRDTLEAGVDRLQSEGLDSVDVVVIALADQPTIRVDVIAELLRVAIEHPGSAIVPTYEGKGGHPIVVPWGMLQKLSSLPRGVGLNALMKASDSSVVRWPIDDADILEDLDEPSDYDRHLGRPWSD